MGILAASARLAHETFFHFGAAANGFPIRDHGLPDIRFHVKLTLHAVDQNFQVQFTHARHNGLSGFFIHANPERGVLIGQFRQRARQFFLVRLALGLYGDMHHRFRKVH